MVGFFVRVLGRIFLEGSFLKGSLKEGSFWKDLFGRIFLEGSFWKDLFGRIIFERIS